MARPDCIQLPCPMCGEEDARVSVNLAELNGDVFNCQECGNDFSDEKIAGIIRRWVPILAWLDTVPAPE